MAAASTAAAACDQFERVGDGNSGGNWSYTTIHSSLDISFLISLPSILSSIAHFAASDPRQDAILLIEPAARSSLEMVPFPSAMECELLGADGRPNESKWLFLPSLTRPPRGGHSDGARSTRSFLRPFVHSSTSNNAFLSLVMHLVRRACSAHPSPSNRPTDMKYFVSVGDEIELLIERAPD